MALKRRPQLESELDKFTFLEFEVEEDPDSDDLKEWDYETYDSDQCRYGEKLWLKNGNTEKDLELVGYCLRFRALQSNAGLSALEAAAYLSDGRESLGDVARDFGVGADEARWARERALAAVGKPGLRADEVPLIRRTVGEPGEPYRILPASTKQRADDPVPGVDARLTWMAREIAGPREWRIQVEPLPYRLPMWDFQMSCGTQRLFVPDYLTDGAPDRVRESYLSAILSRFADYDVDRDDGPFLDWIGDRSFRARHRETFVRRNPKLSRGTKGVCKDLARSVDRLTESGIMYEDDSVLVAWTSEWNLELYFVLAGMMGAAPVPRALDRPEVPSYVMDYAVFVGELRCSMPGRSFRREFVKSLGRFPEDEARMARAWFREHGIDICPELWKEDLGPPYYGYERRKNRAEAGGRPRRPPLADG